MHINSLLTFCFTLLLQITYKIQSKTCYRKQTKKLRYNSTDNSTSLTSAALCRNENFGSWMLKTYLGTSWSIAVTVAYTLTSSQQDLWNICISCRNSAELQSLINLLWFFLSFFFFFSFLSHGSLFDRLFWWSLG